MGSRLCRHRRKQPFDTDLDITAFMNLMVVLVPFLLITAVFSQLSILELLLPGNQYNHSEPPKNLGLEVRVFNTGSISVHTKNKGVIAEVKAPAVTTSKLNALLRDVKNRFPSETAITLLIEDNVAYEDVIHFMDAVRLTTKEVNGKIIKVALFPDIAIGSLSASKETSNTNTASRHLSIGYPG
jgi:biopolymer transport protein ExbD